MELICIKCPRGCNLKIDNDNVTGNLCPRGVTYAKEELTSPMRMVTSLIKVKGKIVPVKTSKEVPKSMIKDILNEISKVNIDVTNIGKTVIRNVCETGADIIVTGEPY